VAANSAFYDLAVTYPDDSELKEAETRGGICMPRGAVRLREAPLSCWVELEMTEQGLSAKSKTLQQDIQQHRKIILARIEVLNCRLKQPVSLAQRPDARPDCGPYITADRVKPVPWNDPIEIDSSGSPIQTGSSREGVQALTVFAVSATVSTAHAGFRTPPCYSAHLEGLRIVPEADVVSGSPTSESTPFLLFVDMSHVQNADTQHFTIFTLIAPLLFTEPKDAASEITTKQIMDYLKRAWTLVWMGVEG
jgi:hypothetical protein